MTKENNAARWFWVEQTRAGSIRVLIGRVFCTEHELRLAVGPYAMINSTNGECHVWGAIRASYRCTPASIAEEHKRDMAACGIAI